MRATEEQGAGVSTDGPLTLGRHLRCLRPLRSIGGRGPAAGEEVAVSKMVDLAGLDTPDRTPLSGPK